MKLKSNLIALSAIGIMGVSTANAGKDYPEIYPFVPYETSYIHSEVERLSEDDGYLKNFQLIMNAGLHSGTTKDKPWTSTFWPLNKGLIADPYENALLNYYNPFSVFSWTKNRNDYRKRKEDFHQKISELDSEKLERLAPSEKYDLLLGDKDFGLTNRIWKYMQQWGSQKEYGFLFSINKIGGGAKEFADMMLENNWVNPDGTPFNEEEAMAEAIKKRGGLTEYYAQRLWKAGQASSLSAAMPEGKRMALQNRDQFVLKEKNSYMATWEGICHGWSTAAGIVPRPRKSVSFKLPDGRDLKFFPTDIKGLVAMLWANSLIQDSKFIDKETGNNIGGGIIMQGLRCNEKRPKSDEWGRFYDDKPDGFSGRLEPRCVGVHPAIWHLGLINIIGKQGRSFIVERKIKAAVDNHPLWKYKMEFFNPYNGKYSEKMNEVYMPFSSEHDQFSEFRNPNTKFIVGVKTDMVYLDWERPKRDETDSEEDDSEKTKTMLYDLELDSRANIIGGQWRATEVGGPNTRSRSGEQVQLNHNQPDFFWVVTKDWKPFFNEVDTILENGEQKSLTPWSDLSSVPPADWKIAAQSAHSFVYNKTHAYGWNETCDVVNKDTDTYLKVPCEFKVNQPQPLVNVVNKLIELSR